MENFVELKKEELQQIDGGLWQVLVVGLIIDSIINYEAAAAAFSQGYADAH